MKRVLITGVNSFVGTAVRQYLAQWPDAYRVDAVSVRDGAWKEMSFASYDVIFHVAGIAHSEVKSLSEEAKNRYYEINTELTARMAQKAKAEGVSQFIHMSSAIVYGEAARIGEDKLITAETPCAPANVYGDSKVQAEKRLQELQDADFRVVLLRCPMIYGKGGKGNFPVLEKLALKLFLFPKVENKRSMLYVKNLAEFVRLMIEHEESGVFWPCNKECTSTSELVRMIAKCHGKKVFLMPGFGWALRILGKFSGYVNKAFGSLQYAEGLGDYKIEYRLYDLTESIRQTEGQL